LSEPDNDESALSILDIARLCYETYHRAAGATPIPWGDVSDAEAERWYYVALVPLECIDALEHTEEIG